MAAVLSNFTQHVLLEPAQRQGPQRISGATIIPAGHDFGVQNQLAILIRKFKAEMSRSTNRLNSTASKAARFRHSEC
ncbi:hypothetical protein AO716_06520 [Arthrobacter sp. Edens01]|nr:hypothetical protein [Arthrobacter sp. Edens01]KPN19427.1 hypothetical protein AO716_06520 [Arthrobacter sp. Edens01]